MCVVWFQTTISKYKRNNSRDGKAKPLHGRFYLARYYSCALPRLFLYSWCAKRSEIDVFRTEVEIFSY